MSLDKIDLSVVVDGKPTVVVTICGDGSITKGPAYFTDDDASHKFWTLVSEAFPAWRHRVIEKAISDRIVAVAQEYEQMLRNIVAAGTGSMLFGVNTPSLMAERLQTTLGLLASITTQAMKFQTEGKAVLDAPGNKQNS